MKYLGYFLYFIIATVVFYYLSRYVATQENDSFGLIAGNFIRGLIIVITGYLIAIKIQKRE